MDLCTDADQLALMSAFHSVTADMPLLLWLHGGKVMELYGTLVKVESRLEVDNAMEAPRDVR